MPKRPILIISKGEKLPFFTKKETNMSELLERALKLANEAEALALRVRHYEAVTIDGEVVKPAVSETEGAQVKTSAGHNAGERSAPRLSITDQSS